MVSGFVIMKRDLVLWITILAGPILWLCAFEANFALAPFACIFQSKLALIGVWTAGIVLSLISALRARSIWREVGANFELQEAGSATRTRAMSIGGMALSAGFALVMVAQLIPVLMLGVCE
jgi:hypothetical protein